MDDTQHVECSKDYEENQELAAKRSRWLQQEDDVSRKKKSKWDSLPESGELSSRDQSDLSQPTLVVENAPAGTTESVIVLFLSGALMSVMGEEVTAIASDSNKAPIHKATVLLNGTTMTFLLLLRDVQSQNACLALCGIKFGGNDLIIMKEDLWKRSQASKSSGETAHQFESTTKIENKRITVSNFPVEMTETEVRFVLEQLGSLAYFNVLRNNNGVFRGCAQCEYEDSSITTVAMQALNGANCRGRQLTMEITSKSNPQVLSSTPTSTNVTKLPTSITARVFSNPVVANYVESSRRLGQTPSKVVQLINCVFQEDLLDDSEYDSILSDVKQEASKYGVLESVTIPRPPADLSYRPGVGKIFLHYYDVTAARKARWEFNGRRYDDRRVTCAAFYPLDKFIQKIYSLN